MSLAEGVLQLIEDAARQQAFAKVQTVWLEIGQLSGVEPEAMAFCFDAVTRGSIAQGARLEIIRLAHGADRAGHPVQEQRLCHAWPTASTSTSAASSR
jgi:hydrogenase nickel insertion protein HypA